MDVKQIFKLVNRIDKTIFVNHKYYGKVPIT